MREGTHADLLAGRFSGVRYRNGSAIGVHPVDHFGRLCIWCAHIARIMRAMNIDGFDHKILDALQRDASVTNADIGAAVGLSASQVSRRRARLEEQGITRRYRAEIDGARLGFTVTVFIHVSLATHSRDNARR